MNELRIPDESLSDLFWLNYQAKERFVLSAGGTSSGKTIAILQTLFCKAIEEPSIVITVAARSVPVIKAGAWLDANNILKWDGDKYPMSEYFRLHVSKINESDRVIFLKNDSRIEFKSFESVESAKGAKRKYLYCCEANGLEKEVCLLLFDRTIGEGSQIFMCWNPVSRWWVYDELIGKPDTLFMISDHRRNPFLSEEDHARIEGIDNPDRWRVYARGYLGRVDGLIYPDFEIVDKLPVAYKQRMVGIDFGFTNKTAITEVRLVMENRFGYAKEVLYIRELMYKSQVTVSQIARCLRENGVDSNCLLVGDSASPGLISDLQQCGFRHLQPAEKGSDSVINGIYTLYEFPLKVTKDSENVIKEFNSYSWGTDKNGLKTGAPEKRNDHAMDSIRYCALNFLRKKPL